MWKKHKRILIYVTKIKTLNHFFFITDIWLWGKIVQRNVYQLKWEHTFCPRKLFKWNKFTRKFPSNKILWNISRFREDMKILKIDNGSKIQTFTQWNDNMHDSTQQNTKSSEYIKAAKNLIRFSHFFVRTEVTKPHWSPLIISLRNEHLAELQLLLPPSQLSNLGPWKSYIPLQWWNCKGEGTLVYDR